MKPKIRTRYLITATKNAGHNRGETRYEFEVGSADLAATMIRLWGELGGDNYSCNRYDSLSEVISVYGEEDCPAAARTCGKWPLYEINYGGVDAEYITPDNDEELAASLIGDAGDWGLRFDEAESVAIADRVAILREYGGLFEASMRVYIVNLSEENLISLLDRAGLFADPDKNDDEFDAAIAEAFDAMW